MSQQPRRNHTGGGVFYPNSSPNSATDSVLSTLSKHTDQLRAELSGYQERISALHNALQIEKTKAKRALKLFEELERIGNENRAGETPAAPSKFPGFS
jgi:hypothetical protein